jgi:Ca-activated chloride channel family protein
MSRLADPWWLALIPVIVAVAYLRYRRAGRPTVIYSSLAGLRDVPRTFAQRIKAWLPALEILGLCSLVFAMARPQSGLEDVRLSSLGVAIGLVVDRSDSMREVDLDPDPFDRRRVTRLDVVKEVIADFVDEDGDLPGRAQDLVGLVTFAGYVKVNCPLTLDHELLNRILEEVDVPQVLDRRKDQELVMTALGDALVIAVGRLREAPAKSRVIVLLSDGRNTIGVATPAMGADAAQAEAIKVYTVGIGTTGGGLDEKSLQDIAARTQGRYFNARSATDLKEIYRQIDELERTEIDALTATRWQDLFPYGLLVGLGLLVLHRLLVDTRFRSLP